ncbi:MFS transporter [Saezia sanguinis]|uniref:MFS transporter n=1 Tax=Saezia sanguinis TaxID=1965230 RepID=UPI00304C0EE1
MDGAIDYTEKAVAEGSAQPAVPDGLPAPQRHWAVLGIMMGLMLSVMESTMVNVALPTIARELNVSGAASVWIVNAYNLSILAFLLPCAAWGERIGLQRVFRLGMAVFMCASLGCMLSDTLVQLCVFKVIQGVGAAAMMSMMGGLTRFTYPSHLFGRGIGINAMTVAVSSMLGPLVCSLILSIANWHWLFFLNIPLCVFALYVTRLLPQTPRKHKPFDYVSAVLCAFTLCLFVFSVDHIYSHSLRSVAGMAVALVCGYILVRRVRHEDQPLVPLDLFRIEPFAFAVMASAFSFAGYMVALVALPFHLQLFFGLTQLQAGYLLGVWPIGSGMMALVAARLAERYSASVLAGIGASVMGFAMLGLACVPAYTPVPVLAVFITLVGVGFGFFQMPNNKAMLSSAPRERSGAAGGVQATTRVFSQSMGAALVAFALALPVLQTTTIALLCGCACTLAAVAVNVIRFRVQRAP